MRPKHLAIALSRLTPHPCLDVKLEQYATEGDLASYWMLAVDELDGLEGKTVVDLGAGHGILGIACLMLGAKHVHFVECDPDALEVLRENLATFGSELHGRTTVQEIQLGQDNVDFTDVDIVVMNPPWGVQQAKADRPFLLAAFATQASAIHLLHSDQASHLEALAADHGWESEAVLRTDFRLPAAYQHHTKHTGRTGVQCWRFHRQGDQRLPANDE